MARALIRCECSRLPPRTASLRRGLASRSSPLLVSSLSPPSLARSTSAASASASAGKRRTTSTVTSLSNKENDRPSTPSILATTVSDALASWHAHPRAPSLLPAHTIDRRITLSQALTRFVSLPHSSLPLIVVNERGVVTGMLTQRDVVDVIADSPDSWSNVIVDTVMIKSRDMACLKGHNSLTDCLTLMTRAHLHYLPFVQENDITGFLSLPGLLAAAFTAENSSSRSHSFRPQPSQLRSTSTNSASSPSPSQSAKDLYMRTIMPHLGLPRDTTVNKQSKINHNDRVTHPAVNHSQPQSQPRAQPSNAAAADGGTRQVAPSSPSPAPLFFDIGHSQLPHPDKMKTGGEDTYVISPSTDDCRWSAFAIFDGVGSWSFEQGIDVSAFSHAMRDSLTHTIQQSRAQSQLRVPSPSQLLSSTWNSVQSQSVVGSCTACLMTIEPTDDGHAILRALSVGDSGFIVVRPKANNNDSSAVDGTHTHTNTIIESDSESQAELIPITGPQQSSLAALASSSSPSQSHYTVHFRSTQQLHYFNCPYQLGLTKQHENAFDRVEDGVSSACQLSDGDWIVMASDGLFDNVTEDVILAIIDEHTSSCPDSDRAGDGTSSRVVASVAQSLSARALQHSWDRTVDSPFAILAKEHNIQWGGGRRDDITVIVIRVQSSVG